MKKYRPYIISVLIALAVGGASYFLTKDSFDLYESVTRPPLSPPSFLFFIVWTILYAVMGIAAALVSTASYTKQNKKQNALFTYYTSLFVNFAWSPLFFNCRAFLFSFLWLVLLEVLIIKTILEYSEISKLAAYSQIPYALWVTFAGYLNLAVYILNK